MAAREWKRLYRIAFFDIDGTLLRTDRTLSGATIHAVRTLRANHVHVMLASARPPFNIEQLMTELGLQSYISFNGAYVVHEGRVLVEHKLDWQQMAGLRDDVLESGGSIILNGVEGFQLLGPDTALIRDTYLARSWKLSAELSRPPNDIYQLEVFCDEVDIARYQEAYPEMRFFPWGVRKTAFNGLSAQVSKAAGIRQVLAKLGLQPSQAIAFGDGVNDMEMIDVVGMGIAMGNAVADLRHRADFVTRHVDEDGVAHALQVLGLISSVVEE